MQMFQPYATTYGVLLTITSLFSSMRLQTHKNINTECPSLLRTAGVSLLPSDPPARPTAQQQNSGSASTLSPVCFPVTLVQFKLCRKHQAADRTSQTRKQIEALLATWASPQNPRASPRLLPGWRGDFASRQQAS